MIKIKVLVFEINELRMVIELSGVQFGLKSYAWFEISNERAARVWFEITSIMILD